MEPQAQERGRLWTLVLVSVGLFMVVLDNLVVNVALPSIHNDFGASVPALEWTVNAYVLAYGVLLLTGAALGDHFGRRRMFVAGISLFTLASAGAALAPSVDLLIAARAIQGIGAAIVTPLTLTLLANAFPPEKRGVALGVWSGISGIAVAIGPLVGGAMIEIADWHWIFWLNVPIGIVLAPLAYRKLEESYGTKAPLDLPGLGLASTGLFGLVFGLVRAQTIGWTSAEVMISLGAGIVLLAAFVRQELRTESPMLPMQFFAKRSFAVTNVVSMAMYFGMFGSIFFLSQFMQNVLGNTPLEAGLKLLVWTGATMVVAPLAGIFSERFGARWFMVAGLSLQTIALGWVMARVFAPPAGAILNSVRVDQAGQASGATNAIRELGGTFGIAVLATVFSGAGAHTTPQAFLDGLVPALWVGVGVLTFGALTAALLPFGGKATVAEDAEFEELEEARRDTPRGEHPQPLPAAN